MNRILLIRQTSPLRNISEAEVVAALTPEEQRLDRSQIELPMSKFTDSIEQGDWSGQDQYIRAKAALVRHEANEQNAALHYFGLAEVAHTIALGAHLGDERAIVAHDHARETGSWAWPSDSQTLEIVSIGDDQLSSVVKARGRSTIRVAISAAISDSDVREVVGEETLADVMITHRDPNGAAVGRVQSAADVELIRREFRRVFALIRNTRPNTEVIDLFVAAPPSVCLAVGQELTLRNSPPIQLYRYRKSGSGASQQQAILLTSLGEEQVLTPLTDEEKRSAARVRNEIWPMALRDLKSYLANKRSEQRAGSEWYIGLRPKAIEDAEAFSDLPAVERYLPENATVDPEPYFGDFRYDRQLQRWFLGDRLLLGLLRAVAHNDLRLRQLIRLFLLHEYVHLYHSITEHTSEEVGKFSSCLEYLDYAADSYAILHQLDLERRADGSLLEPQNARKFLASQTELAIKSFWAFDETTGSVWQVRRLRRYFNWYWRLVQLQNASDLDLVIHVFKRQPHVEMGGLYQVASGRRLFAYLERTEPSTYLELGIVLENERFFRVSNSPNTNLPALLQSFVNGEHAAILKFFRAVYDTAETTGGVQPGAH